MNNDFTGRGEIRTVEILCKLFPKSEILLQVPIKNLISEESYKKLGQEYKKHKHDIVIMTPNPIIIEVNYKHGSIASKKWQVYKTCLEEECHNTVTIDDNECLSLFQLNGDHTNTWQDYIDIINALEKSGVNPQ